MTATVPSPPSLPACAWRSLCVDDAPALVQLELDCAPLDGGTSLGTVEDYRRRLEEAGDNLQTDTLCAVDSTGRLAVCAWVACDHHLKHEYRAFLDGRVYPEYRGRGLGSFLVLWMEARASQILATLGEERPGVLRFDFYDRGKDAVALFEQHGYKLAFAEDEMRRDLGQPTPVFPMPDAVTFVTWSAQRAPLFFEVYQDSFRERPRFPHWSDDTWRHNLTDHVTFRADLSLLLLDGAEAVGFAICHVEEGGNPESGGEGWIAQMGVRPSWRGRGLGGALLSEVLHRFHGSGLRWAALEVSIDNSSALRLYQRLGFEHVRRRCSFQKAVDQSA